MDKDFKQNGSKFSTAIYEIIDEQLTADLSFFGRLNLKMVLYL
jgi:hypothetical protein